MKALVFEQYGKAANVLHLKDIPEPEPKDGQVKVRMLLSPVNPSDIYNTIEGTYRNAVGRTIWNHGRSESDFSIDPDGERLIPQLPHIPGLEGVGIVVSAGKGLRGKFLVGKRVVVVGGAKGNWQEFNVVDDKQAIPVNSSLTGEQAATSFVNPVTAYIMIREILNCRNGEYLIQSAANSELGKMVIRLGKEFGFKTINLIRKESQKGHLKSLGADHVIDISSEDLKAKVHEITNGKGLKYALDPVGGELGSNMIQCLGLGGRMLVYGTLSSQPLTFSARDLMTPLANIEGFFLTNWMADKSLIKKLSVIRKVGKLVKSGVLGTEQGPVFDLEDYRQALDAVIEPGNKGKVLLRMNAK